MSTEPSLPMKKSLYDSFSFYVNKYNGENNSDITTNGELRFIKNNLSQCKVVFDVGANVGEWTNLALKINPALIIHCFEPSSYTFKKLTSNNFSNNIICNNIGFSSEISTQKLHIFEDGSGLNSLYKRKGLEPSYGLKTPNKTEQITLTTLDEYCQQNNIQQIDFLKIDVEGHEYEVFKGAKNLLKSTAIKMIQFEYGGCNIDSKVFLKDLFEYFQNTSYSFYKIYPNYIKQINQYDQKLDNFQYQNWLIIENYYKFIS